MRQMSNVVFSFHLLICSFRNLQHEEYFFRQQMKAACMYPAAAAIFRGNIHDHALIQRRSASTVVNCACLGLRAASCFIRKLLSVGCRQFSDGSSHNKKGIVNIFIFVSDIMGRH